MSQPSQRPQITDIVLIKNPVGEGHLNITGFLNALLEFDDATKVTDWPQKLENWKAVIIANNEDIMMNLDVQDIDKITYQNILHRSNWNRRIAEGIELVNI